MSTPKWKDAISVFVSNAANLMKSIKDLLKATQLAQAIPNNINSTTTMGVTPLVQPHQHAVHPNVAHAARVPATVLTYTESPAALTPDHSNLPHLHEPATYMPRAVSQSARAHKQRVSTIQPPTPQQPLVLEYSSPNVPALVPSTATAAAQSPPALSKEDMATVCRYLHSLRGKWKSLGTFLCVDHSSLEAVQADSDSCDERLVELVALWLRQTTPPPTWQALADAVQYFDPSKAEEIRREQLM